jgi:hypothetical protein
MSTPVQPTTRHSTSGWYRYRQYAVCADGARREVMNEVYALSEYEALKLVNRWNKQNLTDPFQYHYFLTDEFTPASSRDSGSYSGKVRQVKLTEENEKP